MASGTGRCWVGVRGSGIRQGIHRSISKIGGQVDHLPVARAEIWPASSDANTTQVFSISALLPLRARFAQLTDGMGGGCGVR
jgi:hypothetical protein